MGFLCTINTYIKVINKLTLSPNVTKQTPLTSKWKESNNMLTKNWIFSEQLNKNIDYIGRIITQCKLTNSLLLGAKTHIEQKDLFDLGNTLIILVM